METKSSDGSSGCGCLWDVGEIPILDKILEVWSSLIFTVSEDPSRQRSLGKEDMAGSSPSP